MLIWSSFVSLLGLEEEKNLYTRVIYEMLFKTAHNDTCVQDTLRYVPVLKHTHAHKHVHKYTPRQCAYSD